MTDSKDKDQEGVQLDESEAPESEARPLLESAAPAEDGGSADTGRGKSLLVKVAIGMAVVASLLAAGFMFRWWFPAPAPVEVPVSVTSSGNVSAGVEQAHLLRGLEEVFGAGLLATAGPLRLGEAGAVQVKYGADEDGIPVAAVSVNAYEGVSLLSADRFLRLSNAGEGEFQGMAWKCGRSFNAFKSFVSPIVPDVEEVIIVVDETFSSGPFVNGPSVITMDVHNGTAWQKVWNATLDEDSVFSVGGMCVTFARRPFRGMRLRASLPGSDFALDDNTFPRNYEGWENVVMHLGTRSAGSLKLGSRRRAEAHRRAEALIGTPLNVTWTEVRILASGELQLLAVEGIAEPMYAVKLAKRCGVKAAELCFFVWRMLKLLLRTVWYGIGCVWWVAWSTIWCILVVVVFVCMLHGYAVSFATHTSVLRACFGGIPMIKDVIEQIEGFVQEPLLANSIGMSMGLDGSIHVYMRDVVLHPFKVRAVALFAIGPAPLPALQRWRSAPALRAAQQG